MNSAPGLAAFQALWNTMSRSIINILGVLYKKIKTEKNTQIDQFSMKCFESHSNETCANTEL